MRPETHKTAFTDFYRRVSTMAIRQLIKDGHCVPLSDDAIEELANKQSERMYAAIWLAEDEAATSREKHY